jgi:uncharacterized protein (DUF433 family)/DNA-binding transcriptional MerR regulator
MATGRKGAMTKTALKPKLGEGIYSVSEATRILRSVGRDASTRGVRAWLDKGLATPIPVEDEDFEVLSFDDLVSLEVVWRFRSLGVSLQKVRHINDQLHGRFPSLDHPFAFQIFLTDGESVWAQIKDRDDVVVELIGKRPNQFAWREAVETFAARIKWSEDQPARAVGWDLSPWVEINPAIQFGAPVVRGTRVPVRTIRANLTAGSPGEVADWYGLEVKAVEGVRDYLALA